MVFVSYGECMHECTNDPIGRAFLIIYKLCVHIQVWIQQALTAKSKEADDNVESLTAEIATLRAKNAKLEETLATERKNAQEAASSSDEAAALKKQVWFVYCVT